MEKVRIGVIGGSGLYAMAELSDVKEYEISTPFGPPSDAVVVGTLRGERVAFIPRHGKGHVHIPTLIPYRSNILALKMMGVEYVISVSACGSLREDIAPGHIVIPDQLFDHTKDDRNRTFFGDGLTAHVSVAEPFCPDLSEVVYQACVEAGATVHKGGAFVTVEGPRFSTKAESNFFRQIGLDIIGMTTSPEAFLAREAEMCYAVIAHVTDYDVWHETEEPVTAEAVIRTLNANIEVAQKAVALTVEKLRDHHERTCGCKDALATAIITRRDAIPPATINKLRPIVGRYFDD